MGARSFDISVVIPTYNEAKNIKELVRRISESFEGSGAGVEIIVVDDNSPDGTAAMAESLKETYPNLEVILRKEERGLATAVVRGWEAAKGRFLAVIDGDMQHPPDIILHLYHDLMEHEADMSVASRKVAGGGTLNWEFHRVVISDVATRIARFFLPVSLFKIRDATTGCFLFRKECADISTLSPHGFKIFLEVLVRGKFSKIIEVPYTFNQRSLGESKMSLKQDMLFIYHLLKLGLVKGEILIPTGALIAFIMLVWWLLSLL